MPEDLKIPILANSYTDLGEFDFSFKGIQILDVKSKQFAEYLDSLEDDEQKWDYWEMFEDTVLSEIAEHEQYYAIVKSNPFENFSYQDIIAAYKLLLIVFPSDLQIQYMLEFDGVDVGMSITSWHRSYTGEYPGNILYLPNPPIAEINEFIKMVFDRVESSDSIGYIIDTYITSYKASHYHFQYLSLCICLEMIVDNSNNQEITYRMRRNVAVLCGENAFTSKVIYDNLGKIYSLRSAIVHGRKYKHEKIEEYLPFLISIVSRTIIELLIHNVNKVKLLNEKITTLGFGDRKKISDGWKIFDFNIFTMTTSNWISLK